MRTRTAPLAARSARSARSARARSQWRTGSWASTRPTTARRASPSTRARSPCPPRACAEEGPGGRVVGYAFARSSVRGKSMSAAQLIQIQLCCNANGATVQLPRCQEAEDVRHTAAIFLERNPCSAAPLEEAAAQPKGMKGYKLVFCAPEPKPTILFAANSRTRRRATALRQGGIG